MVIGSPFPKYRASSQTSILVVMETAKSREVGKIIASYIPWYNHGNMYEKYFSIDMLNCIFN